MCSVRVCKIPWNDSGAVYLAWIKSEILMPKKLVFRSENLYFDAVEPVIKNMRKKV